MKKMDRTHRNYFLIVAALILAILCITGIVQYTDTRDDKLKEQEETAGVQEEESVSGNSGL